MWNIYCFFLLLLKRSGCWIYLPASLLLMESPLCVLAIALGKKYFFDIFCFCVSERTNISFHCLVEKKNPSKLFYLSSLFTSSSPPFEKMNDMLTLKIYSWTSFYTFSQHEIKQFPRFCNVFFSVLCLQVSFLIQGLSMPRMT